MRPVTAGGGPAAVQLPCCFVLLGERERESWFSGTLELVALCTDWNIIFLPTWQQEGQHVFFEGHRRSMKFYAMISNKEGQSSAPSSSKPPEVGRSQCTTEIRSKIRQKRPLYHFLLVLRMLTLHWRFDWIQNDLGGAQHFQVCPRDESVSRDDQLSGVQPILKWGALAHGQDAETE